MNIPDDFNREGLGIEVDFSLPSERVIRALMQIIAWRGRPLAIRVDNGPDYISGRMQYWAENMGIKFMFTQRCSSSPASPRKTPTLSDTIERYDQNGSGAIERSRFQRPGLIYKHDGDPMPYGKSQPSGVRDQLLTGMIIS